MIKKCKKLLATVLAILIAFSCIPFQVFASEAVENTTTETTERNLKWDFIVEVNTVLVRYLGKVDATEEEIEAAVFAMDYDTYMAAQADIEGIKAMLPSLSEEEQEEVLNLDSVEKLGYMEDTMIMLASPMLITGESVSLLSGNVTAAVDSNGTLKESSGTVTVTATGSVISKKTATITITNSSTESATISFDYSASTYNSFTVNGATASATGTCSVQLDAGSSVTVVLKSNSGLSNRTATVVLSNFTYTAAKETSTITFDYDSALGSVTVDSSTVADGGVVEISKDGSTLTATPATGVTFLGWTDGDGIILSTDATFTYNPFNDGSVKAVFTKGTACFGVGSVFLSDNLTLAINYAQSSGINVVFLANNGILPAGNYNIPAGVTLLIPFDSANTLYTNKPDYITYVDSGYTQPTAYRTLTMASGANLTIDGSLNLSAKHIGMSGASVGKGNAPTGTVSFVKMQENSNITINNGGSLYAYGYITGSGNVVANSGATVYEYFQVGDFPGGSNTTELTGDGKRVFLFSQYYIQNIEVPLRLYSGAHEVAVATVDTGVMDTTSTLTFISNSNAMFNLSSGYAVKYYDGANDRLVIDLYGDVTMSPIQMEMGTTMGTTTINSEEYELPITNSITLNAKSGSSFTINQNLALFPGAEINIDEGATGKLGTGISVFVYDVDSWGKYIFAGNSNNVRFLAPPYAPGRTYTRTEANLKDAAVCVNGTFDAIAGFIYTTSNATGAATSLTTDGGANIYSTDNGRIYITPSSTVTTYQFEACVEATSTFGSNTINYVDITAEQAKLTNADGTFTNTTTINDTGVDCKLFVYENGKWVHHEYKKTSETAATCGAAGSITYTCTNCSSTYTEETAKLDTHSYDENGVCTVCGATIPVLLKKDNTSNAIIDNDTLYVYGLEPGKAIEEVFEVNNGGTLEVVAVSNGYVNSTGCLIDVKADDGTVIKTYTVVIFGDVNGDGAVDGLDAIVIDLEANRLISLSGAYAIAADVNADGVIDATDYDMVCSAAALQSVIENPMTASAIAVVCEAEFQEAEAISFMSEAVVADEACAHEYTENVFAPTCTTSGYTVFTCNLCGYSYEGNKTDAKGHVNVKEDEVPATCLATGMTAGMYCTECGEVTVAQEETPALGHNMISFEGRPATYSTVGWEAYEECSRCGKTTYVEIPMLETPLIEDYETFIMYLSLLEQLAYMYSLEVPETDPAELVIKYIRTGVDRYNSGSWGIMAGYEDKNFANYVASIESEINLAEPDNPELWIAICSLKNLGIITVANGDEMDFGHMFGVMDISYHNKTSLNHADVAGWAGDIVDLIGDTADGWVDGLGKTVEVTGTVEEMVAIISEYYLATPDADYEDGSFDLADMRSDLDGYYFMKSVDFVNYTFYEDMGCGDLALAIMEYYTETLDEAQRAKFYLENRLGTTGTREEIRNAVYTAYTGNKMIATLEDTREFKISDISDLRVACCYAFADYVCKLAGDYVNTNENEYFTVFNSEYSTLAPGITQTIKQATTADGKRMVYYLATADITRDDVNVYANYGDNDPSKGWQMQTVEEQMRAAQANNAEVENFNVIAGVNGSGFNMGTGQPAGLLIMDGTVYSDINSNGFFGIGYDGNAVIGTMDEYNTIYKGKIKEGISGFMSFLIKDGEICTTDNSTRASRTAIGITATGKVVFMVLDGRQEPVSCGGSMAEIAQILYEAGCVQAVNLDGGGSSTYVAKQEGADDFGVVNKPSDGYARSVSTSLYVASTAPSSTAFDHAIIESDYDYATANSSVVFTAKGVSATGNEAELPEGAYWAVADSTCATITSDGVLTPLKNNVSIDIYLMLDDTILATKTIETVTPSSLYYSRSSVNVIYGEEYELPVVGRYGNKKVAINANDIAFTLSNITAGTISGFTFVGDEVSGIKNVVVTAALAADSSVTADITIMLNKAGEATFDFDNATGGDRLLAWNREVSNSTTTDNVNYEIINKNADMVTTYAFAIDMSQLEIPDRLQDIVYMLPGADQEDASAWKFLLQLAERVSDMTTVNTTVTFDKNFEVDYSEVKLVSDYFTISGKEFDEETNTLTVKLNWIKQSQAIDVTMANPLCIVSGIKVTPKETADWGSNNKLDAVATGEIDYKIYLRANALYTFSNKAENQEVYGLYPFVNPNLETEKGAYFEDVHATFEDNYTLDCSTQEGWVNVDGGYAYYENGVKLTGVHKIDDYYYDFGESGVNVAKTKYTGLLYDADVQVYRFAKFGEPVSGWQQIGEDWYYFDSTTLAAAVGEAELFDGVVYTFEETGKLSTGVWAPTLYGMRYYYGPNYYRKGWYNIDGKNYCFENSVRLENGYQMVHESNNRHVYYFNEDGSCDKNYIVPDGFYTDRKGYFYSQNGIPLKELQYIDGKYYYFDYTGYAQNNGTYSGRLFKEDYAAYTGLLEIDDVLYYYENGRTGTCGLTEIDGDYYYVYWGGVVKTDGKYYVDTTYCDLPAGNYEFGADGKMLNGVVDKDGTLYYYVNGKTANCGLFKNGDDYYYSYWGGILKTDGKYYVDTTYCDLPAGNYEFGTDGKMLNGVVDKNGTLYYYVNGKTASCGLFKDGDDYYYSYWGGVLKTDGKYYVDTTYCDLPVGNYTFGPDGKMLDGIVDIDGTLYYYINGKTANCGLFKIGDDYYYSYWGGVIKTDGRYYVDTTYCDLPAGNYTFGPDGKMLNGIVDVDGTLYYYVNGRTSTYGLFKVDGDYYYAYWGGVVRTNGKYYVDTTYCDLPVGNYEFGPDGKMLNGVVDKDGTLYYYTNGKTATCGLFKEGDDYYYSYWGGVLKTDGKYYVDTTYCDLPVGNYEFAEDGKMLDGFVTRNGKIYYYENGKPGKIGLNYIDGYYYFITDGGLVKTSGTYYVWETNGLSVGMNYTFDEYGRAVI